MNAKQFRDWYESRNLTQDEVAGLLGIYRNRVSRMATGAVRVSRQTARMLWLCEPLLSLNPAPEAVRRLTAALDSIEGGSTQAEVAGEDGA